MEFQGPPIARRDIAGDPTPTIGVVELVSTVSGMSQTELPPLHDVVDPDALDTVFRDHDVGKVVFPYCGFAVVVSADGRLSLYEPA